MMFKRISRFIGIILVILAIGFVIRLAPGASANTITAQVEYGQANSRLADSEKQLPLGATAVSSGSDVQTGVGELWVYEPNAYALSLAQNSHIQLPGEGDTTIIHHAGKSWYRLLSQAQSWRITLAELAIVPQSEQAVVQVELLSQPDSSVFATVVVVEGEVHISPQNTVVGNDRIARLVRVNNQVQIVVSALDSVRQADPWYQKNKALDSQKPWLHVPDKKQSTIPDWVPSWLMDRLKSLQSP